MHGVNTQSLFLGSRMPVEKTDSVRSSLQTVKDGICTTMMIWFHCACEQWS